MKIRRFSGIALTLAILGTWWAIAALHVIPELFLPGPLQVVDAFRDTFPTILIHTAATLSRAWAGLILGSCLGLFVGLAMCWNEAVFSLLDPLVESVRPVPAIAAIPFFILWFGTGSAGQVFLISLSCAAVLAVDVFHAVGNVSPLIIRAAQSLGATRWTVYRSIILPAIIPALAPGLRIVAALSFSIAVASEFIGAQWGLGFIIMRARRTLETQTILLGMLLIGVLARSTDLALRSALNHITGWSESSTELLQQPREENQL